MEWNWIKWMARPFNTTAQYNTYRLCVSNKSGQLCVVSMHQTAQSSQKCFLLNYKKNVWGTIKLDSKYILLDERRKKERSEHIIFGKMIFIAIKTCSNGNGRKLFEIIHNEHTISLLSCSVEVNLLTFMNCFWCEASTGSFIIFSAVNCMKC